MASNLVVPQELEYIAVETVRARLGNGIHHCATELSIFRVEAVGDKPKFFDGIKIRNQASPQVSPLADVAAIYQKCIGRLALAVH